MMSSISGLDRGFETYDDRFERGKRDGAATVDLALDWLADHSGDDRYFLFVHLFDAHGSYEPSDDYAQAFHSPDPGRKLRRVPKNQRIQDSNDQDILHLNPYVDRYDSLILFLNDQVARLLDSLDLSDTIVLLLSDHGETLGERYHTIDHGGQVFDEQIRIPLLLFAPGLAPEEVRGAVETVDLLPTLLALLGVTPPEDLKIHGRDLAPIIAGDEPGREFIYSTA